MDKKKGVIVSSKSLVLQNVTRHQAGPYQCHAVNTEGDNTSNTATLRVMCEYRSATLRVMRGYCSATHRCA